MLNKCNQMCIQFTILFLSTVKQVNFTKITITWNEIQRKEQQTIIIIIIINHHSNQIKCNHSCFPLLIVFTFISRIILYLLLLPSRICFIHNENLFSSSLLLLLLLILSLLNLQFLSWRLLLLLWLISLSFPIDIVISNI